MNAKIIALLLFPLWGCFAQNLNIRYRDTLVMYEKVLTQCIKEHNDHELDCRKEYYHELQDYESDVFYAVRKVKEKTKTAAEIEAMNVAEGEWKRASYWYIAKLMKEFKDKHPGKFVWDTDADLKADIRIFYIKTAQYFTDRMNYLLSLIKNSQ